MLLLSFFSAVSRPPKPALPRTSYTVQVSAICGHARNPRHLSNCGHVRKPRYQCVCRLRTFQPVACSCVPVRVATAHHARPCKPAQCNRLYFMVLTALWNPRHYCNSGLPTIRLRTFQPAACSCVPVRVATAHPARPCKPAQSNRLYIYILANLWNPRQ